MLDIKFIRENVEEVRAGIRKKNSKVDIDRFIILDDIRKIKQTQLDKQRAELNIYSQEYAKADEDQKQEIIKKITKVKEEVQDLVVDLKKTVDEWHTILMNIPNITSPKMPEGKNEEDNVVIRKWGELPRFDFEPKEHYILAENLDLLDTKKAAEVSGARFYYLKNDLVLIHFALLQFAFETLTNEEIIKNIIKEKNLNLSSKPFIPILPPVMIKAEVQEKIHRVFGDQTYSIVDEELNLVASAEHTLAPYHMDETVDEEDLPLRYVGYSTAFRREAGTYGKDMKGMLRAHQFDKSEMESFTTQESGTDEQELLVGLQEYMMQKLNIPYQVVQICTGDTGKPDYQQFDIECWLPGQKQYRETHTSDYMTDFQTRGISAFYKAKDGKRKLMHTNDATVFAGRPLIAIMENYQQEDGSIVIPEVLRKWIGKDLIKK